MDRLIYVSMSGARHIEKATMINNHNLANINTPGFRADMITATAKAAATSGETTRVYASSKNAGVNLDFGTVVSTGRELDVAINGEGFLAVTSADGSEAYTRRGDLRISDTGILQTGDGHSVLGNSGPISIPSAETIEIATDGTISILPTGQDAAALTVLDRIKLVNPDPEKLQKTADGLLVLNDNSVAGADANIKLETRAIEKSNVNAIEALVTMIELSRAYENQINLIHKASEMDTNTSETMRLA